MRPSATARWRAGLAEVVWFIFHIDRTKIQPEGPHWTLEHQTPDEVAAAWYANNQPA